MRPKVSVVVITYNQEQYIEQCLDSILMQQTDFDFDIWIGEDDSSDRTREIVLEYKRRYPAKINLLLHDRKDVIYIDGKPTGRWNLIDTLQHAPGQYIAYTEGDDYWTDPLKLQKQADHLDSHPNHAMCFHYVTKIFENGERPDHIYPTYIARSEYSLKDMILGIGTPSTSLMFRNNLFGDFPDWYYQVPQGDFPLHILNAQHGKIGFLREVMGVYRIHPGGVFSTKSALQKLQWTIRKFEMIKPVVGPNYEAIIESEIYWRQCQISTLKRQRTSAWRFMGNHIATSPTTALTRPGRLVKQALKLSLPKAVERLKRFKYSRKASYFQDGLDKPDDDNHPSHDYA